MANFTSTLRLAIAWLFLFSFLSLPNAAHAQAADPAADRDAVDKLMHDYFAVYSQGDMAAVMKLVNVPFVVQGGPKGFTTFATSDEALAWYTKFHDGLVKQGYAKSQWIEFGVRLLGNSHAIAGGTYARYKADGSELNRSGGTYLLSKVDGVWRIGVLMGYPEKDAFKLQ